MVRTPQSESMKDRQDRVISHVGHDTGAGSSLWQQAAARLGWSSLSDGIVGSAGCAAALTCASFAAYMSVHPQPSFNGIEHLMIFAQPNYQESPAFAAAPTAANSKGIDYSATGTIRPIDKSAFMHPREPIVTSYRLHYMHDGEALIVGKDDAVYQVSRGSIVPGIGPVVAIEERHGQWVVVTPRGLIVSR